MSIESPELSEQSKGIEVDLSCSKCGYNLKGLETSGNCPECGQPIEQTINFGLHCADPAWLKYQSVTMLLLAALAVIPPSFPYRFHWLAYGFRLIASMIDFYAVWRFTRPDRDDAFQRDGPVRRGMLVIAVISLATAVYKSEQYWDYDFTMLSAITLRFLSTIVQWWIVLFMIVRLARRTSDQLLIKHARFCLWSYPIALVVAPVSWTILSTQHPGAAVLRGILTFINSALLLVTVLLLGRMFEVLRRISDMPRPTSPMLSLPESCEATPFPLPPASLKSPAPGSSSAAP